MEHQARRRCRAWTGGLVRRRGRTAWKFAASAAAVLLAGAGTAYAAGHGHHAKKGGRHGGSAVTAVQVAPATPGTAISSLSLAGSVTAAASLALSPATAGRVSVIHVSVGQAVQAGQTLLQLANPVLQAQLTEAVAAVSTAQAKLAAAEVGPSPQAVAVAQAEVAKALVALQAAQQSYAQALAAGPKAQASQAQASQAVAEAQAALSLAQAQAAEAEAPPPAASLAPLVDAVTQAQDAEAVTQTELAQDSVVAPFAGVVTAEPAVVGEQVSPATTLLTLQGSGLSVQAPVSQTDLALVSPGEAASISVPGEPAALAGSVTALSPAGNPSSLTFEVTVVPGAQPPWLHAGEAASVAVTTSSGGAVLVPADAVVSINGHPQVFTVDGAHRVSLVDVTPGVSDGTTSAVGGLAPGTEVVTLGQTYLAPGDLVRITATSPVPSTVTGSSVGGLLTEPIATPTTAGTKTAKKGGGGGGGGGGGTAAGLGSGG